MTMPMCDKTVSIRRLSTCYKLWAVCVCVSHCKYLLCRMLDNEMRIRFLFVSRNRFDDGTKSSQDALCLPLRANRFFPSAIILIYLSLGIFRAPTRGCNYDFWIIAGCVWVKVLPSYSHNTNQSTLTLPPRLSHLSWSRWRVDGGARCFLSL